MGRRSRERLRGEEANEALRAELEPLDEGERPGAVTAGAIVAFVMAAANVAAALFGADLSTSEKENNAAQFTAITTVILVMAGIGMLRAKYWAVLGFQVILAFQIIILSLALLRVETWYYALGVLVALGLLGWLFWKLVRAMARIQMPER